MTDCDLKKQFSENHIITDCTGNGSVMVYVKKFFLDEVIDGAPHIPHPAFIVASKELDGIYISKFQNVVIDGRAYSLPDQDPATNITFDRASDACLTKGNGFHLMSAAEWGAVALWCQKNGHLPFGNNDIGKDIREEKTVARPSFVDKERGIFRVATGSGPVEWSHNRKPDGIYDLNANVWEWVSGLRLVYGELQILSSIKCSAAPDSDDWRAIDGTDGSLLMPDKCGTTKNSIKLDNVDGCWTYVTNKLSSREDSIRFCRLVDVKVDASICNKAKELLYALGCLLPYYNPELSQVSLYANNGAAERIAFRGGRWGQGLNSGIFKTCLDDPRSYSGDAVGFRSAYYEI